jgi:hypothetical protein
MGMLVVAFLTAATNSGPAAKVTFTLSRTRSLAASDVMSGLKPVKRYSMATFFALYVTRFSQTLPERGNQMWYRLGRWRGVEKTDHRYTGLLRARRERPSCCATNH